MSLRTKLSEIGRVLRGRSPAQHYALLSRRLRDLERLTAAAEGELRRIKGRTRGKVVIRATRRVRRLKRRTKRARALVARFKPYIPVDK